MFRPSKCVSETFNDGYCLGCFFLFTQFESHLQSVFKRLFDGGGGAKAKAASKSAGLEYFGWYLQIKSTAEKGVFTFGNNSPIKSVEKTNLYDFLLYLAAEKAEGVYQKKIIEYDS